MTRIFMQYRAVRQMAREERNPSMVVALRSLAERMAVVIGEGA